MKLWLRALFLPVLLLGIAGCGTSQPPRGLRTVRATMQTGSNLPQRTYLTSGEEVRPARKRAEKKKTKAKPSKEDREYLPRGGFR